MKLYRGIQSLDYIERNAEIEKRFLDGWKKILHFRRKGDFSYPEKLNETIVELYKIQSLNRQYFTDNKTVAEKYLKAGGVMIEIDVPQEDILNNFIIEFQNYSKRRMQFELTYLVHSKKLLENKKNWKLKITKQTR